MQSYPTFREPRGTYRLVRVLPGEVPVHAVLSREELESDDRQRLFTMLYAELHRLARRELRRTGPFATLSPTTLLHEVYLNLHKRDGVAFSDSAQFLAYASRAMRGLM